ncbi:MAG: hypothetical protein ABSF63_06875 [Candidatus Bathyarchaeia archaeon]|jgi:hypothetical protein
MSDNSLVLADFADLCTLVYHEARRGQQLTGYFNDQEKQEYSKVIKLSIVREEAWSQLQATRRKARNAETAARVRQVFEVEFGVSLSDLVGLFSHPVGHSESFPHPWVKIASVVIELGNALERSNIRQSQDLDELVMNMQHMTGTIREKLQNLDQKSP